MTLSKSLAQSLLKLIEGEKIPASKLRHHLINELLSEGIITDTRSGRTKSLLYVPKVESLTSFLWNRYSIDDLKLYLEVLTKEDVTRAELVKVASNSKIKRVRTFTGFLVNSFEPVSATLKGESIIIHPVVGTFLFINEPSGFRPTKEVTIVGVENPENFKRIAWQKHLFEGINPLFICRYPQGQSKDLIMWLKNIPNPYLHFGDFDFAGIGIYLNEYKCHLGLRAKFFVPDGIKELIRKHGNVHLYNKQNLPDCQTVISESRVLELIDIMHLYKKGLEQEILINQYTNDR